MLCWDRLDGKQWLGGNVGKKYLLLCGGTCKTIGGNAHNPLNNGGERFWEGKFRLLYEPSQALK